jgi:hypothetical protein
MSAVWALLRFSVLLAPFILHLGVRHFDLLDSTPTWATNGAFAASIAAVALAVHDYRALRDKGGGIHPVVTILCILLATPFVWFSLFLLINFLSLIDALPYAVALVIMAQRIIRRWSAGREVT